MAIPNIVKEDIINALEYIDEKGIPVHNQSTRYDMITEDGKKYPPKYVIAVAAHIANGEVIDVSRFTAIEAKNFLRGKGFDVRMKQDDFVLTITADSVTSTDNRFDINDLGLGDDYKPVDAFFKNGNGEIIKRIYRKGERKITNQTLPRIAFQVYEKNIISLTNEEMMKFPVCKYNPKSNMICGIFSSEEDFKKNRNTFEFLEYYYGDNKEFVIYCWNIFSTLYFIQECLKRFGGKDDKFILQYCKKEKEPGIDPELILKVDYKNPYSNILLESKNIIFRGAPGTGKTYLAREIAADIVSDGIIQNYSDLSDEQKKQIEFVQFHPSYDYSDFVEGLRPKANSDGTMGFELKDGIFKSFVSRARKNYENSRKTEKEIKTELSVQETLADFFSNIEFGITEFSTVNGSRFIITNVDDEHIDIFIPENVNVNKLKLNIDEITKMLESGIKFSKVKDITDFFGKKFGTQQYSYDFAIYNEIKSKKYSALKINIEPEKEKKYVFIIDEINRGEISKILGELFFAIDPGYRGKAGEVSTQYANLHANPDDKFYIPENVYIIGTMNDIDRSVDSFDFAMRRRFRFINIKADERLEMLDCLSENIRDEAIKRMESLNSAILKVDGLNENYQIGASYFLKLKNHTFVQLWTDYLQPLLQDYVQGIYEEDVILNKLSEAYESGASDKDESAED